jgi:hypothetical protein
MLGRVSRLTKGLHIHQYICVHVLSCIYTPWVSRQLFDELRARHLIATATSTATPALQSLAGIVGGGLHHFEGGACRPVKWGWVI